MSQIRLRAGTDRTVRVVLRDGNGDPVTTLAYNTSSFTVKYYRPGAATPTTITLATQTVNGAHSDGGFVHIEEGLYRLDPPDAAFAAGVDEVFFYFSHSSIKTEWLIVPLADYDTTLAPPTLQQIADAIRDLVTIKGRTLGKILSVIASAVVGRNIGTANAPLLKSIDASESHTIVTSNGDRTNTGGVNWTDA